MEMNPYLFQAIVSIISFILVFIIIGFTTRNIIRGSRVRMFFTLFISMAIGIGVSLLLTHFFGAPIAKFFSFINYSLVEIMIAGLISSLLFGFFFKNYLLERNIFLTSAIIFASYVIISYWLVPYVVAFIN